MLTRSLLAPGRPGPYLRYALLGHRFVHGWLSDLGLRVVDAADAVQRQNHVSGPIAEIGVHHGRLFILMSLTRLPGETAVALDLFEDQHLNIDSSGFGDRATFERNLRRWHPDHGLVKIVQCDSRDLTASALRELAGDALRLVSIDGGHTVEITMTDLATATESLRPGGIVILDDCFSDFFPSVSEGAQRFLQATAEFEAFAVGGNKTLICHADWSERYRSALRPMFQFGPVHIEQRIFLGRPILAMERYPERAANLRYWTDHSRRKLLAMAKGRG